MAGRICQGPQGKPTVTPSETKAELRQRILARLKSLTATERAARSEILCHRLIEQEFWKRAKTVLLFAPLPDEVNIWPVLEHALAEGKIVTLPRHNPLDKSYTAAQVTDPSRNLVTATFGIREPAPSCREISLAQIDLALIPGVGFDLAGGRLGRGGGFYDRLLAEFPGVKCAVVLDEQIANEIPSEQHDVRMNVILTGTRIIWVNDIGQPLR
jgi:5-formyltetrahydrofolate cyclo-ligase